MPLGWRPVFFSEIEPFPCAVLEQRHPGVPNRGDMTKFKEWPDDPTFDVLAGGTPCQSYSVAGLRAGLDDPRGDLMLTFAGVARRYRPRWLVWENVPGVLSSGGGRDFGTLLAVLSGRTVECPADGWRNAGIVPGIEGGYGLAWRVLDAQYFGVPQRRRRVFVVGCLGNWRGAAAVLLELASLRGDPAPRRTKGEGTAAAAEGGARASSGHVAHACRASDGGIDREDANTIIADVAPALQAQSTPTSGQAGAEFGLVAFGGNNKRSAIDVATAVRAKGGTGHGDFESETFIAFDCKRNASDSAAEEVAPTLRAQSDRGESNAVGGGQFAVAIPINADALRGEGTAETPSADAAGRVRLRDPGFGVGEDGDPAGTIAAAGPGAVAFESRLARNGRGAPSEVCPPLKAQSGESGRGDAAPLVFNTTQITHAENRANPQPGDPCHPLGLSDHAPALINSMQVRRLTPRECERLQGFEDDYTLITYRGKPAADGPRYKALGNSMAVPCMVWLGRRIQMVNDILYGENAGTNTRG